MILDHCQVHLGIWNHRDCHSALAAAHCHKRTTYNYHQPVSKSTHSLASGFETLINWVFFPFEKTDFFFKFWFDDLFLKNGIYWGVHLPLLWFLIRLISHRARHRKKGQIYITKSSTVRIVEVANEALNSCKSPFNSPCAAFDSFGWG